MFEKIFSWYFNVEPETFSKEDQKLLYLQNRHWIFVTAACFIAIELVSVIIAEVFAIISQNFIATLIVTVICALTAVYVFIKYSYTMTRYLYPRIITKRGKAISKIDFKNIKRSSPSLYNVIMSDKCCGVCYFISFAIMYVLKKGYIQFIAVKQFYEIGEEKKETYKIHVVYVNNGWCFDTYSQRQMPIEELCDIWKGKLIEKYNYDEIKGKTFEEFRDSIQPKLINWCRENDCTYFVRR